VAAYRPEERSAELTQALNDVFWLWFIGIVGTIIIQNITLAIAARNGRASTALSSAPETPNRIQSLCST
ncbi:hypothetical protein C6A85_15530, partial [Mycobacterium sp. ITM-2017-0098]